MIDKSMRKATATRISPDIIKIHYTGGGDCLWMDMYLDRSNGQMLADSDIGAYSMRISLKEVEWVNKPFFDYVCGALANEDWLLYHVVNVNHLPVKFDAEASGQNLIQMCEEYGFDETELDAIKCIVEDASDYNDMKAWSAIIEVETADGDWPLPEEWETCKVTRYTAWQKRFAEICRENIAPAIRELLFREECDHGEHAGSAF